MTENVNPYESQGSVSTGGYSRNNYSQGNSSGYQNRNNSGGYNKPQGGGYQKQGGNKPGFQKREYSPEELKNLKIAITCVVTGNENFQDQVALSVGRIVKALEQKNVIVRTGGLNGIDLVVLDNARAAELHLPFKNYNKMEAPSQYSSEPCLEIARRFMPDLESLPNVPKATFAKNPRLVLGRYLTAPAQLVIVWSEDGCENPQEVTSRSGMAGHVAKIAAGSGIRVINLQRPDAEARVMKFIESIYVEEPTRNPDPANANTQGPGSASAGSQPTTTNNPTNNYQPPPATGGYQQSNPVYNY